MSPATALDEPKPKPAIVGGDYDAVENDDGTWDIKDVPIMLADEGKGITPAWMKEAVKTAQKRLSQDKYLSPMQVQHEKPNQPPPESAGFFIPERVGDFTYEGKKRSAVFATLRVRSWVYSRIKRGELTYRSVHILDARKKEINALSLMDSLTPFFRLPMLTIGKETKRDKGIEDEFGPELLRSDEVDHEEFHYRALPEGGLAIAYSAQGDPAMTDPKKTPATPAPNKDDPVKPEGEIKQNLPVPGAMPGVPGVAPAPAPVAPAPAPAVAPQPTMADMMTVMMQILQLLKGGAKPGVKPAEPNAPPAPAPAIAQTAEPAAVGEIKLQAEVDGLKAWRQEEERKVKATALVAKAKSETLKGLMLGADAEQNLQYFAAQGEEQFNAYVGVLKSHAPRVPGQLVHEEVPETENEHVLRYSASDERLQAAREGKKMFEDLRDKHMIDGEMKLERYLEINVGKPDPAAA